MLDEKISIITVSYNAEKTIEKTICSVLGQKYSNIEYIIIDGASNDDTLNIIKKYANQIAFWSSEPDNGIYDAMNKGLEKATGDIIAFLNSDDWYPMDAVENVVKAFERDVDIVYGDTIKVRENGCEVYSSAENSPIEDLHYHMVMCHQAVFARKALFVKYGNFNLNYRIASDYEWLLKCFVNKARFIYIPKGVCYFRDGGVSSTQILPCVKEQRQIALKYLPEQKKDKYLLLINEMYQGAIYRVKMEEIEQKLVINHDSNLKQVLYKYVEENEKVVVWGSGYYSSSCIRWLETVGVQVLKVFDNDIRNKGKTIGKIKIEKFSDASEIPYKIVVSSIKYQDEISRQLMECGYKMGSDFVRFGDIRNDLINAVKV